MKKALVLISAVVLLALSASAATTCTTEDPLVPAVNVLSAGFTCSVGPLTFSNFSLVNMGTEAAGTMTLRANQVGSIVYLNFNPSMAVGAGRQADEYFYFMVTGGVDAVDLSVGGGNASITERVCATPIEVNAGNSCSVPAGAPAPNPALAATPWLDPGRAPYYQLAVMVGASSMGRQTVDFSDPWAAGGAGGGYTARGGGYVSPLYIYKDILLQGPGELSSFSQSFSVPEPMTMALFGSGLLALGLIRRFRRS